MGNVIGEGVVSTHRGVEIMVVRHHTTGDTQVFIKTDGQIVREEHLKVFINDFECKGPGDIHADIGK